MSKQGFNFARLIARASCSELIVQGVGGRIRARDNHGFDPSPPSSRQLRTKDLVQLEAGYRVRRTVVAQHNLRFGSVCFGAVPSRPLGRYGNRQRAPQQDEHVQPSPGP